MTARYFSTIDPAAIDRAFDSSLSDEYMPTVDVGTPIDPETHSRCVLCRKAFLHSALFRRRADDDLACGPCSDAAEEAASADRAQLEESAAFEAEFPHKAYLV